ncbi:MAG TPA: DUF1015 family protein [Ignavibacteriales bacterium]|nr:DUF1015 family protein [Ignavibacteriales bacterium]
MAVIRPFKALRPAPESAPTTASVPYDVVNREEAAAYAKDYPYSYLRVTRAEIELDAKVDPYSEEVYKKAKENLEKIKKSAPLLVESEPRLYLYKLVMKGRSQTGIAATFSVDDYNKDIVMKHEKTRKEKEDDRTKHIITTEAQTGPVFLTYKGVKKVDEIVEQTMKETKPVYDFTAPDGIQHTVWILPEKYTDAVVSEIAKVDKLYIADGHHRAASAARAQKAKMDANKNHTGKEEYNYFLAVLFPAEQLHIMPYNRVVHDLNGLNDEQFFDKIKQNFTAEQTKLQEPPSKRSFCLYFKKQWYLLKPNANVKKSAGIGDNLDVSILQNYLLHPVLGIDDPRTSKRVDFIGGIRGTAELVKLVDTGKAVAAFSLYPVGLDDLMNISNAGEIMPPKSTWFEPKLRDGLLVHLI